MRTRSRPAFSLFELIVLIGLLGFFMALALPAVFKVRQAASRMQSSNNLKQLGIACHSYHSSFEQFPPGLDDNGFSATARLMPYIEQAAVYNLIDFKKPVTDKANDRARAVQVKTLLDPQDPILSVTKESGATNYLFNAGSKYSLKENDGVFYLNSKTTLPSITDGTSNTLMIAETLKGDGSNKAVTVQRQYVLLKEDALKDLDDKSGVEDFKDNKNIAGDRCASWMDGHFLQGTWTGTRSTNDSRPDVSCGGAGGLSGLRSLAGGNNIGLCDGSVRYLSKDVSFKTLQLLSSRNDGQVLPPDF